MKVRRCKNSSAILIYCPGCKRGHAFYTSANDSPNGAVWVFNGDSNEPTFSPSMHITTTDQTTGKKKTLCHSFVRDGLIEFLSDSTHELAGQTVELPDYT